jgi:hypothetical protein
MAKLADDLREFALPTSPSHSVLARFHVRLQSYFEPNRQSPVVMIDALALKHAPQSWHQVVLNVTGRRQLLARQLLKEAGHALMDRMIDSLSDEQLEACVSGQRDGPMPAGGWPCDSGRQPCRCFA